MDISTAFTSGLDVAVTLTPERGSAENVTVPAIYVATYIDGMTTTTASLGLTNVNAVATSDMF